MTSNTETRREGLKMASSFYIVNHHFKPGMAAEWWGKTGALMSDEAAFAENIKSTMEKGFLIIPSCQWLLKVLSTVSGKPKRVFQTLNFKILLMGLMGLIGGWLH